MQPKSLSLALSMVLSLAAGTAAPSAELGQNARYNPDGLCRRAAALPPMPPEPRARPDQQQREEPMLMTPVEAPPAPMPAPPPVADGVSEDATDVMVTGTRVRSPALEFGFARHQRRHRRGRRGRAAAGGLRTAGLCQRPAPLGHAHRRRP